MASFSTCGFLLRSASHYYRQGWFLQLPTAVYQLPGCRLIREDTSFKDASLACFRPLNTWFPPRTRICALTRDRQFCSRGEEIPLHVKRMLLRLKLGCISPDQLSLCNGRCRVLRQRRQRGFVSTESTKARSVSTVVTQPT